MGKQRHELMALLANLMTNPSSQSVDVAGARRLASQPEELTSLKRQKQDHTVSTVPLRGDTCFKQRLLSLQGFTGYPHLRVKWEDGMFYDAIVEKVVAQGVRVEYSTDGSSEVIDIADASSFDRFSACRDLDFRDLEDACTAAADEDPQSSDEADESAEVYEVERILGKRLLKGKTEYLVSWKGYDETHNSFEPRSNLGDCKEIMTEFETKIMTEARAAASVKNANDWQRVEETWLSEGGKLADQIVPYSTNYEFTSNNSSNQPAVQCCSILGSGNRCEQHAKAGRGYCAHHLGIVQSRMLGIFCSALTTEDELKMMRLQDVQREKPSIPMEQ